MANNLFRRNFELLCFKVLVDSVHLKDNITYLTNRVNLGGIGEDVVVNLDEETRDERKRPTIVERMMGSVH